MTQPLDIFCNPLPLPQIGRGICCRLQDTDLTSFMGEKHDFREVSDPEMLYHDGVWYMYPSVSQAFVSKDLIHWDYFPLDIEADLGYAPSVCKCGDHFLLTASCLFRSANGPTIYSAPTPLGPFKSSGQLKTIHGKSFSSYCDPSLFCDDDGRLFIFYGSSPIGGGIIGCELDPSNPSQAVSDFVTLIQFNSKNSWEHFGEYGEHLNTGWDEGVALFKHKGIYYLQYASCGTQFRHYAVSCYMSSTSPLGPYTPPKEPMVISPHGIVTGTGHGGMVTGPDNTVWQFYTCLLRRSHFYERRVGMDKVTFAPDGTPQVKVTSTPQSLSRGDLGLVPVTVNKRLIQSSYYQSNYGNFAVDECTHTWWAPDPEDKEPSLTVSLSGNFDIQAVRIIWTELNLDYDAGITPEPVKFKIEFLDKDKKLLPFLVDMSQNNIEHSVENLFFKPVSCDYVKLTILCGNDKIHHGVTDFTAFALPK